MDCAPSLKSSFELIPIILATQPKRQYWLTNRHWARLVAASDAAQDGDRIGSGGYLILWVSPAIRSREAFVAAMPDEVHSGHPEDRSARDADDRTRPCQPSQPVQA